MKKLFEYIGVCTGGILIGIILHLWFQRMEEEVDNKQSDNISVVWRQNHFLLNEDNLYNELVAQGIDYPQIVLAQAILETENFKSNSCVYHNNLFGIRCYNGVYADFEHWTDCVAAYKKYVQNYNEVPKDYYKYLQEFTEDSTYIEKLKQIK